MFDETKVLGYEIKGTECILRTKLWSEHQYDFQFKPFWETWSMLYSCYFTKSVTLGGPHSFMIFLYFIVLRNRLCKPNCEHFFRFRETFCDYHFYYKFSVLQLCQQNYFSTSIYFFCLLTSFYVSQRKFHVQRQ